MDPKNFLTTQVAMIVGGAAALATAAAALTWSKYPLRWIVGLAFTSVLYYFWARAVKGKTLAAATGTPRPA